MSVSVRDIGEERVPARGERERGLWYDSQGIPVRVLRKGRNGSDVVDALR